jgi:sensor c-di-GMP phosphodiesterase-like protein
MVRLRRKVGAGLDSIAALVPTCLFLPQVASQGGPFSAYGRIATQSGTTIGERGPPPKAGAADPFTASARSGKFGFRAEVVTPRGPIPADKADMRWLGTIGSGAIAVIFAMVATLMGRRQPGNPVAEIENTLQAGEFVPYYQPVVDIRSGQLRAPKCWCAGRSRTARWCCRAPSFRWRSRAGSSAR